MKQSPPKARSDATWPWPKVGSIQVQKGVRKWLSKSPDGTTLDLFEFDFKENPDLIFAIYDQDEDDQVPFDNKADFFGRGVGQVVSDLNKERGSVIVAWNGLFYGYDRGAGAPPRGWANHIGPVVLNGKIHHNVGRHRWTFGSKRTGGHLEFKALFEPTVDQLRGAFDFAADGAQLLVKDGAPTKIQSFQDSIDGKRPEDTNEDAGAYPGVDWTRTSRTSIAWSKDHRYLWTLIVVEPDNELESRLASKYGRTDEGGWTLTDLQSFWIKFGAWGAINSDGGIVTQFAWKLPTEGYEVVPSLQSGQKGRIQTKDLTSTPGGGSLLTFYVYTGKP